MPEIKHTFQGGKMNKDLDERLVPNGEYRDAMNIQVRTTDGDGNGLGDSGTVQNIQGNIIVGKPWVETEYDSGEISSKTIGSVKDEKSNSAYFFIAGLDLDTTLDSIGSVNSEKLYIDTIFETKTGENGELSSSSPIVVDKWAVTNSRNNVLGTLGPPQSSFQTLTVSPGITEHLRVGMMVKALDSDGINQLNSGAEIQRIDGDDLVLYKRQSNPQWVDVIIFLFEAPRVLNFNRKYRINGANIIDDFLIWTDGQVGIHKGEPKKININRCREGTTSVTSHTQLKLKDPKDKDVLLDYTDDLQYPLAPSINNDLREEHITVIRKAPRTSPTLTMSNSDRDGEVVVYGFEYDFLGEAQSAGEELENGYELTLENIDLFATPNDPNWQENDVLIFTEEIGLSSAQSVIKVTVNEFDTANGELNVTVISVSTNINVQNLNVDGSGFWTIELERDKALFELKMARFGYRYKYEDGEYSSYSPWSELAFLPGPYDYNHKKGFNLGMVNTLRRLKLSGFVPHQRTRNADVAAIDILYKTTESPNVYIVRTVKRGIDPEWDLFTTNDLNTSYVFGEITITSEMIHQAVDASQLLRAWDNVPRYALAQEIAANRLMFSNYVQGYDIKDHVGLITSHIPSDDASEGSPKKSVKSLRTYKFGMVFGDKYGRETPVIQNGYLTGDSINNYSMLDGDVTVDKEFASMRNYFELVQDWESVGNNVYSTPDQWIEYVKYYVKETSNEYYNLVMDRWYNAEDGNVWLSFASADRNKIDEETYIILKSEHGSAEPVIDQARYKIIAIEEEAPDFIKTQNRPMGMVALSTDDYDFMFPGITDSTTADNNSPITLMTETVMTISGSSWEGFLDDYQTKGDLEMRIVGLHNGAYKYSSSWRNITYNGGGGGGGSENFNDAVIRWSSAFGESADMLERFQLEGTVTGLVYLLDFREKVVVNTFPQFDGKFFVKIERDVTLEDKIMKFAGSSVDYDVGGQMRLGYIDSQEYHPTPMVSGQRYGYRWFGTGEVAPITNSGDTGWTNENTGLDNVASLTDLNGGTSGWPGAPPINGMAGWNNYDYTTGDGQVWNMGNFGANFMALGCDHYTADAMPSGTFTDNTPGSWDEVASVIPAPGDSGYDVVNFTVPTRTYWEWIRTEVEEPNSAHYRLFIDSCRLAKGKLTGGNQTVSDRNVDGDADRYHEYYKPTGMDPGYQSGGGFNPTEDGEYGRIFISGHTNELWGFGPGADGEISFRNHMITPGNCFRFTSCPGDNGVGYTYQIVGVHDTLTKNNGRNYNKLANMSGEWETGFPTGDWGGNPGSATWGSGSGGDDTITYYDSNGNTAFIGMNDDAQSNSANTTYTDPDGDTFSLAQVMIGGTDIGPQPNGDNNGCGPCESRWNDSGDWDFCRREGFRVEFRRINTETNELETGPNGGVGAKGLDPEEWDPLAQVCHDGREALGMSMVFKFTTLGDESIPVSNAAVWETEPKEDVGLDLYYEASHAIPMVLTSENTSDFAPYNCSVTVKDPNLNNYTLGTLFTDHHISHIGYTGDTSIVAIKSTDIQTIGTVALHTLSTEFYIGDHIVFHHSDGTKTMSKITGYATPIDSNLVTNISESTFTVNSSTNYNINQRTGYYEIDSEVWRYPIQLGWYNCFSFGNGVESDRIRDDFNQVTIDNGVKVSSTFLDYGEETKGSTIIYSGVYNSISGVNNLNEFNMSETITKDLNPSYGSIQALKTRDTDVVVLAEDKILKITTHKDALYNADGNAQLLASNRVLGTAVPFAGDYGISKNPESTAWDNFRLYFTDMQRGAVLRLTNNGLTPISSVGMKTWFRENLKLTNNLLGTFDTINGEYNLTLNYKPAVKKRNTTISFNEASKGWISFKSFIPEAGESVSGKYLTNVGGNVWEHYHDILNSLETQVINRNTFYGEGEDYYTASTIDVLFNDMPGFVKSFRTCNYEGSQGKINQFVNSGDFAAMQPDGVTPFNDTDGEYYNLQAMDGWYVKNIITDQSDTASIPEFIEKEGKWFNSIGGDNRGDLIPQDYSEFSLQGIGQVVTTANPTTTTISMQIESDYIDDDSNPNFPDLLYDTE